MAKTIVIFRKYPSDDSIIALMPKGDAAVCICYDMSGKGEIDYVDAIRQTERAFPDDYEFAQECLEDQGFELDIRAMRPTIKHKVSLG